MIRVVVSAQHPLEKIPRAEAKAAAPNLGKEVSTLRKGVSEWDERLPKELLCTVSGEALVTDQCVTQAVTCSSQASEGSQERGRVPGGAGWRMGPAVSAEIN